MSTRSTVTCALLETTQEWWPFTVGWADVPHWGRKGEPLISSFHEYQIQVSNEYAFPVCILFGLACWAEIFLYFHKFGHISYDYSILLKLIKTAATKWPRTFSVWLSLLKLRSGNNIIANHWFAKFWCLFSVWVRTLDTNSILESRDYSGTQSSWKGDRFQRLLRWC